MTYKDINEMEQQSFARRMKRFRKEHGLTQVQLGAALGLSEWTISILENCRERPYSSTVLRFAKLEEKYEKAEALEMESLEGLS
jgi:DNA-binding XRE family transcriptional regulator